ncbi:MAG TPA: M55 family metallopeptidase [Limnochordia bacterium]|nr:M55 family metallopeptidase [Limnochordia bacterium]
MRILIVTDLEGVVGVDHFAQTRTSDEAAKAPGMHQLAREVNACIEGIHAVDPGAEVDVWDGHGNGGLFAGEVQGGRYVRGGKPYYQLAGFDAQYFVGQHAMAGTIAAPLCHTYSSLSVAYYRLNGVFVGEFGARALVAGRQGVPTIFLSGDDKAAYEAQMFVPEIETVVVKQGKGLEAAEHLDPAAACDAIRAGAARALRRLREIPPFTGIEPPYTFEMRTYEPSRDRKWEGAEAVRLDERTVQVKSDRLEALPF